jgi:hypothetical protein
MKEMVFLMVYIVNSILTDSDIRKKNIIGSLGEYKTNRYLFSRYAHLTLPNSQSLTLHTH